MCQNTTNTRKSEKKKGTIEASIGRYTFPDDRRNHLQRNHSRTNENHNSAHVISLRRRERNPEIRRKRASGFLSIANRSREKSSVATRGREIRAGVLTTRTDGEREAKRDRVQLRFDSRKKTAMKEGSGGWGGGAQNPRLVAVVVQELGGDAGEGAVKEDSEQGEAAHEDGQAPDEPIVVGDPVAYQIPPGFRASVSPLRTKETKL